MIKNLFLLHLIIVLITISGCKSNNSSFSIPTQQKTDEFFTTITQTANTDPTVTSTEKPEVNQGFAGRILLATHDENGYSIYTLQEGFTYPVPLWVNIEGELPDNYRIQPSKDYLVAIASPDGNWVVLNNTLVDLKTGESKKIVDQETASFYPAFSPDNRFLALTIEGTHTRAKLLIINLRDGTQTEIYAGDCANYSYLGTDLGNSYTYCGRISQPAWLDENRLIFSTHRGDMPSCVYCGNSDTLEPNALLMVNREGEILYDISQKGLVFRKLYKNADYLQKEFLIEKYDLIQALQYSPSHSPEPIFISVSSLYEGEIKTENPPIKTNYQWDRVIPSPDATYYFDPIGKLIKADTTEERNFLYFYNCDAGMIWSPDSTRFICLSDTNSRLFPLSIYSVDQETPVFSFNLQTLNKEWWNLIAWQP